MRISISHLRRAAAAMLSLVLTLCPALSLASTTSLTCAIVATDDLQLRPLELNQRDVVSVLDLVYEGLFSMDDNYMPQPKLAYSYEFANEGRRLRVVLRSDVTFHNGQQLTSADVIATLNQMYALSGFDENLNSDVALTERGLYYSTFYSLKSWEAEDDYTLLFTLRRASYGSLYAFTFPILPASQVNSDMPAGTGPYKYDGYEQGSAIWLTANTSWWQRTPQIRNIRASIYKDSEKALNAFDLQDVDVAMSRSINASRYSGSLSSFSLSARTRQLEVLLVNRAQSMFKSDENGQNPVREAIAYAINRSEIISSIYQGMATVAYTPVPAGTWISNESTINDIYDPLMAASLLDSAGYKLADDGKRYKDGKQLEGLRLQVYDEPGSTVRTNAANKIKEQLEAVGFTVSVATLSRDDVLKNLSNGNYFIAMCGFNFDVNPDPGFTVTSTGACNYTRYRSDDMNNLLTQLRSSYTAESYRSTMSLIQDQFEQDMPYLCLYWRSGALLSRSAFTNARDIRELELLRGVESFTD
ncbi:MAG: ABC transporter substrate-binding protein [Clostridia bacterium]|nr:ABC transporter substrate-binding protein [Clostridia bacterium]